MPSTKFKQLSEGLQERLLWIKDEQLKGFYNKEGHYAEWDSFDCKPWTHELMLEAQHCDMLVIHPSSDFAYPFDDYLDVEYEEEREEQSGVAFISIKPEFLDQIVDE